MNAPFLQADGIRKRHGGIHALEGVDLDLGAGEAHVLPGESRTAGDMPNLRRTS